VTLERINHEEQSRAYDEVKARMEEHYRDPYAWATREGMLQDGIPQDLPPGMYVQDALDEFGLEEDDRETLMNEPEPYPVISAWDVVVFRAWGLHYEEERDYELGLIESLELEEDE
jgi:hypothetical protein